MKSRVFTAIGLPYHSVLSPLFAVPRSTLLLDEELRQTGRPTLPPLTGPRTRPRSARQELIFNFFGRGRGSIQFCSSSRCSESQDLSIFASPQHLLTRHSVRSMTRTAGSLIKGAIYLVPMMG
ncbi:hypothetical protein ASPSYDRAFT_670385 [Aspergillus sydowii CBS 593.65]|uniref:Uncharacterized protein n=1 Tax=Aspergillus sydowii CBS 593.65 TaxID=1036612 RepID=A0A1L9TTQ6_9EURO|nr:uncharacterized protein ASPSYDRAFT_670385 [Aspergillus sydowii CBS 593.65]OJJ62827.1 hypothetical protein ASPSYDRAFT_670385 [Aspergillus sydowii CBS 593.65]